ncbi:hypothetical protein [Rhizobium sp. RU36D]|uniref:hypothetical protein n=1 Tax=Rhizobium sp. RU36D TaxID=1907415 RepID=UPI000A04ACC2|nr:hypothetical protein [Rhizobium sp. RU36D]
MRSVIRLMLVLAALAYGAMPFTGMAGPMAATGPAQAAATQADTGHDGHEAHAASAPQMHHEPAPDGDCPHPGKTMASGHCAACLTLPADILIAESGPPARSTLTPRLMATLTSRAAPPLDPPPRV